MQWNLFRRSSFRPLTNQEGQNVDKGIIGLLGGASVLAVVGGAAAASTLDGASGLQPARSFAELLDPIPNAASVLKAEIERAPAEAAA